MRMLFPIVASLLLFAAPSPGSAQGLPVGFDDRMGEPMSLAEAGLSAMPDHPPSATETSVARARVVRRAGQTIRLIGEDGAARPAGVAIASAAVASR